MTTRVKDPVQSILVVFYIEGIYYTYFKCLVIMAVCVCVCVCDEKN